MLFQKDNNNSWQLNKDVLRNAISHGFPLAQANKIVYCQTTADPLHAPTAEMSQELTEMSFEGVDADISYVDAGHLCIIPTIPMVHESFMAMGIKTLYQWSRHRTPESKVHEAAECQKLYHNLVSSLDRYF